jgi:FHS family L-fucose permease-like MFS transporter
MQERPSSLLWVFFLAYFTFGMMYVLGALTPDIISEYHLSRFGAGFLGSAFYLAYALCSIPTGLIMDRIGARPLILLGVALMVLGCAAVSQAHNYALILSMVFAVGVGVTMLQTSGNPLIQQLDRPENYHRNLTITIAFAGFGPFFSPFILAYIRGTGRPWQALYLVFAGTCLLVLILLAFSRFPARAESGDRIRPEQLGRLLLNPIVLTYTLGIFCYVAAEVGTAFWIPKFFEDVHGVPAAVSSAGAATLIRRVFPSLPAFIFALFWGMQGTGRLVGGAVLNRFGSRRILRIFSAMALVCLLLAIFGSTAMTAVGFALCGFFTSVLFTLIFSGTINSFSEYRGTISGLLCTAVLGGAVIPPLEGLLGDHLGMRPAMMVPAVAFAYVFGLAMFGRAKYE